MNTTYNADSDTQDKHQKETPVSVSDLNQAPEALLDDAPRKSHTKKRTSIALRRTLVGLLVIAVMCFSLAFHSGLGTPSSMGIGQFNLMCPLAGFEVLLSSKTFIPVAVISLVVVLILCLIVGRAWCAWACPANLIGELFNRKQERPAAPLAQSSIFKTIKSDSRMWVLFGVFIAAFVLGFPVFCLICPVGLTFGTISSLWRLVQFNDVNWGLIVFPLSLIIELVVHRKWCINICPIGALLSLIGRFAKPLRPVISESTCIKSKGGECGACAAACPATIDLHAEDSAVQLADCTRCGECSAACPTDSITYPVRAKKGTND